MIQVVKQALIPISAMVAGILLVVLVSSTLRNSQTNAEGAIVKQFAQLPAGNQERILNNASTFETLRENRPKEWERINSLHAAVSTDPALKNKLNRFHEWWRALDASERQQLRNDDGSFVKDWSGVVESISSRRKASGASISVTVTTGGPGRRTSQPVVWHFTEGDYRNFLDAIIPQPTPSGLAEKLKSFDDTSSRSLVKTVWLLREFSPSFRQGPGRDRSRTIAGETVQQAFTDHLAPQELKGSLRRASRQNGHREHDRIVFLALQFVGAAMNHLEVGFRKRYLGDEKESLLAVYEEQDRAFQLDLMAKDPDEAKRALQDILIHDLRQTDPAVATFARELRKAQAGLLRLRNDRPRGPERRGDRGPGGPPHRFDGPGGPPGRERFEGGGSPRHRPPPRRRPPN